MNRSKILIGTAILSLILFALSISINSSLSATEHQDIVSNNRSQQTLIDQNVAQLYNWQQKELKVAIKAYFDKAIASGDIVGAGVSIVRGDSILFADGFGKRNSNRDDYINGQTIFRLGSLSKGFTGILAVNLEEEGKLNWDDKVSDFIPQFRLGNKSNTDKVTLANILSHSSGAPYHSFTNLVEAGLPLTTIAERFKEVRPIGAPGQIYSYQNALFALAGEMMCLATDEEITTALENRFFAPLEMCSATMDYEILANTENVAMPHSKRRYGWRPNKLNDHYYNAIAAGGINANANDMAKWMRFLLGRHPEIMTKTDIAEAFNPVIKIPGRSKYYQRWPGHVSSHYGYGWRIHKFVEANTNQEKTIWHHGGSVNNYRNEIAIYPEADLGICILLNSNSKLAKTVVPDLYKIVKMVYGQTNSHMAYNSMPDILDGLIPVTQIY